MFHSYVKLPECISQQTWASKSHAIAKRSCTSCPIVVTGHFLCVTVPVIQTLLPKKNIYSNGPQTFQIKAPYSVTA